MGLKERSMIDFSNKTALLTGAASGIGRATMDLLYKLGANVLAADIDIDTLSELIEGRGVRIRAFSYDAADPRSAARAVAATQEAFGHIDHLALCTGVYKQAPILSMTEAEWAYTQSINLDGTFYMMRAAAPAMSDGGSIVTLASLAAHKGAFGGYTHYGASKGGVLALTRSAATELAPRLRVNCVSPGLIDTPMTIGLIDRMGEDIRKQNPLGRDGKPREIANIVAFLCSDASSFVNGEVIIASGGAYIG